MIVDRQKAKEAFAEYVKNYDIKNLKIKLKIAHTYKVADLCEKIARAIGLLDEDIDIAWLIGLLHDIGRFEQLRQYGTFYDGKSIDHAVFGAKLLFDKGMIRNYVTDNQEDILLKKAIRLHNCYCLPKGMDSRTEMFCNIIRDADKIDIIRVNAQIPLEDIYDVTTEELRDSVVSPAVMQSFLEEHATLRSLKKTPADNIAGHISLVYELVYPISIYLMWEQGFLQKILSFHTNTAARSQFQIIKECVETFIKKRLQENIYLYQ